MNEGDLVRLKDRYAGVWNPPMLLADGFTTATGTSCSLFTQMAPCTGSPLTPAWYYEVINGEE